jgi:mono/diheme cytochrome c family protein
MKRSIAAFALLSSAALAGALPVRAAGDPSAGAKIVQANGCAGCHGANFKGSTGPKLYGIEHQLSAAQIADAIANPKSPMPKFPLTSAQISDVVAYLSSLDGGSGGGGPVATLTPAKPSSQAMLSVRFPGAAPKHVTALPTMQMGASAMHDAKVTLEPTGDPHVWQGKVSFSMGGPWTIDVQYDGKHLTVPVNVAGGSM